MARAEKLLQEAQYAFQNIGHGSSDEQKHAANAKRLAQQIVRKYPVSMEATLARSMLEHLSVDSRPAVSGLLEEPQTLAEVHVHESTSSDGDNNTRTLGTTDSSSWPALWQSLVRLPYVKKKILFFLLFFIALFAGFMPFLLLALVFYFTKPALVKEHLTKLLDVLHAEPRS